jgi:hypothetical protein
MLLILPLISISLPYCPSKLIEFSELEKTVHANNHCLHQELIVFGQYILKFEDVMVTVALQKRWHHIIKLIHIFLLLFCVLKLMLLFSKLFILLFDGL